MNLYLATRPDARSKENHLTNFLAAALNTSAAFRRAYADSVLRPHFERRALGDPSIQGAETQAGQFVGHGTPDLLVRLVGGSMVLCEHKLDAEETVTVRMGSKEAPALLEERPEPEKVKQLAKYLEIPNVVGVAYFAERWRQLDPVVVRNARFIRPSTLSGPGEHFLWRDLYEPLRTAAHDGPLVRWLFEGFEKLGYVPAPRDVGELEPLSDPPADVRLNQEKFVAYWAATRVRLRELGWNRVTAGSRIELYLAENDASLATQIIVDPSVRGRFRIRFTPVLGSESQLESRLASTALGLDPEPVVERVVVERARGRQIVFDLYTALATIWAGASDPTEREIRLADYVTTAVSAARPT